jgi:hypothetical protein
MRDTVERSANNVDEGGDQEERWPFGPLLIIVVSVAAWISIGLAIWLIV